MGLNLRMVWSRSTISPLNSNNKKRGSLAGIALSNYNGKLPWLSLCSALILTNPRSPSHCCHGPRHTAVTGKVEKTKRRCAIEQTIAQFIWNCQLRILIGPFCTKLLKKSMNIAWTVFFARNNQKNCGPQVVERNKQSKQPERQNAVPAGSWGRKCKLKTRWN